MLTTDHIAVRRSPRRFGRILSLLAAVVASFAMVAGLATPASAAYSLTNTDRWGFWDASGSGVYTAGSLSWYKDGYLAPVYRGQINNGSWVALQKRGCLWVKISFTNLTGSVSWPPSASANTVSDGYYRTCGERGTGVYLNGVAHASRTLMSAVICIGYSNYATYTLRRYESCQRMWS